MNRYKKLLPMLVIGFGISSTNLISGEKSEKGETVVAEQQKPKMGHEKKWGSAIDGYSTFTDVVDKAADAAAQKNYTVAFGELKRLGRIDTKNSALNTKLKAIGDDASIIVDKKLTDKNDIKLHVITLVAQTRALALSVKAQFGKDDGFYHTAFKLNKRVLFKWLKDNGFVKHHKKHYKKGGQAGKAGKAGQRRTYGKQAAEVKTTTEA